MTISEIPKIIRRRKSLARLILVLTAGIAAAVWALAITRSPGPGLDPDSASYLGAAQALARGRGYRVPIAPWASADSTAPLAHFPPGYPTLIALPIALGATPLQGGRLLNAVAALAEVGLAAGLVGADAGVIAAVILVIGLLLMPAFLVAHLPILSEPLFLACMLTTLAALTAAARAQSERARLAWSLVSGCTAAAAVMVRYVGVSVCGVSTLWSLLLPGTRRDRLRRAALATAPWLVLSAAWVLRTRHVSGPSAIRSIGEYGAFGQTLRQGVKTLVGFLVPLSPDDTLPGRRWIALLAAALLVYAMVRGVRRTWRLTSERSAVAYGGSATIFRGDSITTLAAVLLLAVSYLAVLLLSRLFADPRIPFDDRLLLPLFLLGAIGAAITVRSWWRATRLLPRLLCGALVVGWLLACYHVSSDDLDWVLENGYDLAGEPWRSSALLAWARANAPDRPLYSNWPTAVVLDLHRPSHDTPITTDSVVLRRFAATLAERHGIVLAFNTAAPDMIGVDALLGTRGLRRIAQLADGSVFAAKP